MNQTMDADVIIIGGGQAALATAYFLKRQKINFLILDNQTQSGGAWQHAWDSLQLFSPNTWSSLSGWLMPKTEQEYPKRLEVIDYLTAYETRYQFPVLRPVQVEKVLKEGNDLIVCSAQQSWRAKAAVSATGTWSQPFIPAYTGRERFLGTQIHSAHYRNGDAFQGKRVMIVGGGNSGAQILAEVSKVAETFWVTQQPPSFLADDVDGRVLFLRATKRLKAQQEGRSIEQPIGGLGDIVMIPSVKEARQRDVLHGLPPFDYLTEHSAVWADGREQEIDAIIWCTGFKAALSHLQSLNVVNAQGTVDVLENRALQQQNLWLVGYGDWTGAASATLIGVSRTARNVAEQIAAYLQTTA